MPKRGFTHKEMLLALLVLLVASAVVFAIGMRLKARSSVRADLGNMRQIYLSLAVYENDENGQMPPNLLAAREQIPDDGTLLSSKDPYASSAAPFPVDGGLPKDSGSPIRISYAYLMSFADKGLLKVKPWSQLKFDPTFGFIADEWQGGVDPTGSFGATVSGAVFRLNTDGALLNFEAPTRPIGDPQILFLPRK